MARDAPIVDSVKDRAKVFQAIRKNQVADALVDPDKAKELKQCIMNGLYEEKCILVNGH